MTTQERFESMLSQDMLSEAQISSIMPLAKESIDRLDHYQITWDRPSNEYDDAIYNSLYTLFIKPIVYEWLENNCPNAFFKELFR